MYVNDIKITFCLIGQICIQLYYDIEKHYNIRSNQIKTHPSQNLLRIHSGFFFGGGVIKVNIVCDTLEKKGQAVVCSLV